jgi:transcription antitermination factor NusG
MNEPVQTAAPFNQTSTLFMNPPDREWYAIYTCARHEKRIADQLALRSIEQFLPLYETVHRWKDRRVRLQLPLFPGYIFVRIPLTDQLRVLQTAGVVRFVSFNGKPAALPEGELSALQRGLSAGVRAEPHPYLVVGRGLHVKSGPLCGLRGKIVRSKENYRLIISVESITRSIICEVALEDVEFDGATLASGDHLKQSAAPRLENIGDRVTRSAAI